MSAMIWLLLAELSITAFGDAVEFESFFPHDAYISAPAEDSFGFLPNYKLSSLDSTLSLRHDFNAPFTSEGLDLPPLYTDGKATLPQVTLSKLEKDYKTQLQKVASATADPGVYGHNGRSYIFSGRVPPFKSEPHFASSNLNERKANTDGFQREPRFSKTVELQTGFVPILGKRGQSGTVFKELDPPILTAASAPTTPTLFKVSASVKSSSKVNPPADDSSIPPTRSESFSRNLDFGKETRVLAVSSSSSESVVIPSDGAQQRDFLRVNEDVKLSAKKTLEINCNGSRDLGWCELGGKYPRKYVDQVVASCQDVIQKMYVEVPHSFEKLSDTSNFKAEIDDGSSRREAKERGSKAHHAWSWAAYFHQGSLCESEAGFLRPETAKDTSGKWNIIVQTDSIRQRVPIEMCRKTNAPCKKSCGLKSSQCLQKYNYQLLLSVNPLQKHDCPFMKLYRLPSACVCHAE